MTTWTRRVFILMFDLARWYLSWNSLQTLPNESTFSAMETFRVNLGRIQYTFCVKNPLTMEIWESLIIDSLSLCFLFLLETMLIYNFLLSFCLLVFLWFIHNFFFLWTTHIPGLPRKYIKILIWSIRQDKSNYYLPSYWSVKT